MKILRKISIYISFVALFFMHSTKFLQELQGLIGKLKEEAGGRAAKRGQRFEKKEKSGEEQ